MAEEPDDQAGQGGREGASPASTPSKGKASAPGSLPAAGPHADPSLTNPDATPGAGSLPDHQTDDVDAGSG